MVEMNLENWFPMSPLMGPPLPKWLGIYWPWYQGEGPPPGGYLCPYCPVGTPGFDTYEELVAHIVTEHPGERIPFEIIWT